MKVLVFDTETTGLPKTKIVTTDTLHLWPHIVQFSYIIYDLSSNEIVEFNDQLVKLPENVVIPQFVTDIHNITNEMCDESGNDIIDVLRNFFYSLRKVDLMIGHNISFDLNMVKAELLRIIHERNLIPKQLKMFKYDLQYINGYDNIYCTLKESIQLCNIKTTGKYGGQYLKYPKLIELHQKLFNTSPNNLHNALYDVLVTLRCFMKLKHDFDLLDGCISFKNMANNICLI